MTTSLSRRLFLGSLAATAATSACANAPATSPRPAARPLKGRAGTGPDAERLIAAAKLGGDVGFLVADARTGEILEARDHARPMPPASTAKVLTSLFALDRLGTGHRFQTRLVADGTVSGSRLDGRLVLAGGGDPTLDTDGLAELAAALKARGIREVTGGLSAFGGALPYQPRIVGDQPVHIGYNPALSGLNLNYNRVYFEWKREGGDYAVTMDARSDKRRPAVHSATMAVAERTSPLYTWSDDDYAERWTVMRAALGKGGGRWLPVRRPERYAADVFNTLARAEGISLGGLSGTALPSGSALAVRQSPPLAEIVHDMLAYSTNVTAEVLGLAASRADALAGSASAMNRFVAERYGAARIRMVDHSGLGEDSRVTAEDMVAVLVGSRGSLLPVLKPIPMRDAGGAPVKNHPVSVHAKTGTLNFVSTLAGYADIPGGRRLAFAILTGDLARRSALSEDEADQAPGAKSWNTRSKGLQQALLARWGQAFAA
jgi:D-alanyl-D-alanine carboxypeptidase/D-alanyl-D-alanine-endopeptidase (penicillin-binding protein 4)